MFNKTFLFLFAGFFVWAATFSAFAAVASANGVVPSGSAVAVEKQATPAGTAALKRPSAPKVILVTEPKPTRVQALKAF